MKKIKFLFFTLLFCFSVPVKADTAFENDDTVLCSFFKRKRTGKCFANRIQFRKRVSKNFFQTYRFLFF